LQTVYYLILIPMVYFAATVFLVGTTARIIKILRLPPHPTTLQIFPARASGWAGALYDTFLFPTVRRHQPVLWVFLILFHACLLLLLIGHLELIADFQIFQIIPHEIFLGKGLVGLTATIAMLYFLFRRFTSPVRQVSVPEDYYLLILLFLIILFGSQMDWARRWYEYGELTVDDYRDYLYSLIIFRPELPYNATFSGHSFLLAVHVFFANLFLIFFPFSQAMHSFLSLPMNRLRRG